MFLSGFVICSLSGLQEGGALRFWPTYHFHLQQHLQANRLHLITNLALLVSFVNLVRSVESGSLAISRVIYSAFTENHLSSKFLWAQIPTEFKSPELCSLSCELSTWSNLYPQTSYCECSSFLLLVIRELSDKQFHKITCHYRVHVQESNQQTLKPLSKLLKQNFWPSICFLKGPKQQEGLKSTHHCYTSQLPNKESTGLM